MFADLNLANLPQKNITEKDDFADRIRDAYGRVLQLRRLLPMMTNISAIGTELDREGAMSVKIAEDYADKAPENLLAKYLPDYGNIA